MLRPRLALPDGSAQFSGKWKVWSVVSIPRLGRPTSPTVWGSVPASSTAAAANHETPGGAAEPPTAVVALASWPAAAWSWQWRADSRRQRTGARFIFGAAASYRPRMSYQVFTR